MSEALFTSGGLAATERARADLPRMQRFFDDNPAYFRMVSGEPAAPNEADEELTRMPPPEWPIGKKWMIGFESGDELVGVADVISDLIAKDVWHVGLFIIAERLWGGRGGPLWRESESRRAAYRHLFAQDVDREDPELI